MGFFKDLGKSIGTRASIKADQKGAVGKSYGIGKDIQKYDVPQMGWNQVQNDMYGQATGGLAGAIGGIGQGGLDQASQNYMMGQIQGQGLDPYASGSPYQQYAQAAMQSMSPMMDKMAGNFASRGMMRGSAAGNASRKAMETMGNQLQMQGYGAYNQGLARQAQMAQFAPQMSLQQAGAQMQGYGQMNQMGQQQAQLGMQNQQMGNQMQQQNYQNYLAQQQAALGAYGQVQGGANLPQGGLGQWFGDVTKSLITSPPVPGVG